MKNIILTLFLLGMATQLNGQTQAPPDSNINNIINSFEEEGCSILEVSEEMFEILARDERASEEIKETLSQLNHLVYLNCFGVNSTKNQEGEFDLTREFKGKADNYGFKLLMRSQSSLSSSYFYKRANGQNNEYLLVTKTSIQYISTELNIMSIRDLTDIIEMAGDAGDL